ncbi:MAG: ribose 5-phosphate isomerase B [Phycisphaerae bacterium]
MKIAIGSDHRGFTTKEHIRVQLEELGNSVTDLGTHSAEPCDYPDAAIKVAKAVSNGEAERAVLICGSGIGVAITANKVPGVRAALCHDAYSAEMSRRHNDANILCIGSDRVGEAAIAEIVRSWITTEFEGGRHARRVAKIMDYEAARDADCKK